MILAYLRGTNDYALAPHSEGVCCKTDKDEFGRSIHADCVLDPERTLLNAYRVFLYGENSTEERWPEWCSWCNGYGDECIHCHTALECAQRYPLSQRTKAFRRLKESWSDPPEEIRRLLYL